MICKSCKQEIDPTKDLELIFSYGVEGGGSDVYRTANGKIISSGSRGGMLDEEEDPFIQWTMKYQLWSSFWSEFKRKNKDWHFMHPMYIHDDFKMQIKKEVTSKEISERQLKKWLDKL